MRVGVVDIGSNSTRLLIADEGRELTRESIVTRLGDQVDASGHLNEAAQQRALSVLDDYAALIRFYSCGRNVALMTSAVRDASNGRDFAARVGELGLDGRIISGDEEARLTFAGAIAGRDPSGLAVIDIGGGSTEVVSAAAHVSMQVGVVRHGERHSNIAALAAEVRETFEAAPLPVASRAIGVAGTPTSAAAMDLGGYDRARVEGHRLSLARLRELHAHLLALSPEERAAVPGLHPARAPVMLPGLTILIELLAVMGVEEIEASERDLMWGAAAELGR